MEAIDPKLSDFLTTAVFIGFLTTTTLVVGLNFKVFKFVFKDNIGKYWWLFLLSALIPLFLFLAISSYILNLDIQLSTKFA
jgi:hypothetical protein